MAWYTPKPEYKKKSLGLFLFIRSGLEHCFAAVQGTDVYINLMLFFCFFCCLFIVFIICWSFYFPLCFAVWRDYRWDGQNQTWLRVVSKFFVIIFAFFFFLVNSEFERYLIETADFPGDFNSICQSFYNLYWWRELWFLISKDSVKEAWL